ncbi:hypothetical protein VM1G_02700 [Cytospora mali]|uniref:Uncharacterized protein n=1 Tax=Cytospora mali TaxID=578113 RepID=A0A194VV15_CYTMA|nr:hypothetical protein VM1G_02700 [Valsa mali]
MLNIKTAAVEGVHIPSGDAHMTTCLGVFSHSTHATQKSPIKLTFILSRIYRPLARSLAATYDAAPSAAEGGFGTGLFEAEILQPGDAVIINFTVLGWSLSSQIL